MKITVAVAAVLATAAACLFSSKAAAQDAATAEDTLDANALLRTKVYLWCTNKRHAWQKYGAPKMWDTSAVTSFRGLFAPDNCPSQTFDEDISTWDTSKGKDMSYMFMNAKEFKGDISGWDVGDVEQMEAMFSNTAKFNAPLARWNIAKVRVKRDMFANAESFNQDLTRWRRAADSKKDQAGADLNRSFTSSVHQRGLSLPLLRDSTTSDLHVDVVITWHCESIEWISDIAPELYPYLTVVLLHKVDASDLTKPECQRHSIPNTLLDTVYIRLPNKGRDTHSPFAYISDHYESLASFTVFMQADHHWSITNNWIPSAQGFASNAEALNHFIPMVLETRARFVPISPIINNEPVLFVDRDSNANKKEQDRYDPPQLKKFDACAHDIPNRVRETHRVLFGASPCSYRTFPFVAGFQFIVRKDMILARPRPIWEGIAKLAYSNCTDFGYAVERLSINLFNSSEVIAVPTSTFEVPLYCKDEGKPYFHEPFDAALAEDFWAKYWSCDSSNDSAAAAWKARRSGGVGVGHMRTNAPAAPVVNCGGHSAKSCGECSPFEGWCNGDCEWDDSIDACIASLSSIHPAYTRLTRMRPFQPVEDEHGRYVNVILVRSPFASKEQEELYEKYKGDILFLGIMSSEAYPLLSPNPWASKFRTDDYIGRFPGWLNMYRSPESIFPQNIPLIQMSHSDFSVVETDYDAELRAGKHEKLYDFMYVMTNTEGDVKDGCTGWGSFTKNWPLAKRSLAVMCSEMNLTGVVLGIVDSNGNSCEIPPPCRGKVLRVGYVNYYEALDYMRQSRFLFVPAVYDASPRVITEAMSLNVPVLMNENIVGGWKYICKETGVFFSGISSLKGSVVELMGNLNTYTPRSYVQQHYGRQIAGKQLKGFVEKFFDHRVKLPKKSNLLIPTEPRRLHDSKTNGTLTSDGSSEAEIPMGLPTSDGSPGAERRVFTVFSTECSNFQDWQSQTLIYSHQAKQIEGELVRLMSCGDGNYQTPHNSYAKYRVVNTPNFNSLFKGEDDYSPRNKPKAFGFWLNGLSADDDLPNGNDIIVAIDPDMIFLDGFKNLSSVHHGAGFAARYNLGRSWIDQWAAPFCDGKCEMLEDDYDPSFGHPLLLTASDMQALAGVWGNLVDRMRLVHHDWETEMYACIIAARIVGITFNVQSMMIANVNDEDEPWDSAHWTGSGTGKLLPPGGASVTVAHYCQGYSVASFRWGKHDYHDLDIRACQSKTFQLPSVEAEVIMQRAREEHPQLDSGGGGATRETLLRNRNTWLLQNTWLPAKCAIAAYYAEFCKEQDVQEPATVNCGGHVAAASCDQCTRDLSNTATWCNGDCEWHATKEACLPKNGGAPECAVFTSAGAHEVIRKTKAQPPLSSLVGSSWAAKNKIASFVISSDEGRFGSFLDANGGRDNETISWHPAASGFVQSNANQWGRLTGGPTINVSLFSGKGKDQFGPHAAGCYVSHHSLIRSLLNEVRGGHPRASAYVVFEDDARCVRGWREALDNALGRLPKDWDIFFIGGRPISYFHHFDKTMLNESTGTSLRRDICKGMFGKAVGPRAPGGGRNISREDPFWRAMYLVHAHAYVLNPDRIERVLEVLERKDDSDIADPIDQRLANSMASGGLIAYMSAENLCEQADLLPTYAPDWDGLSPQPWMGDFGFPEEAVQQHPAILESHMWGKMILDEDDGPECKSGTY